MNLDLQPTITIDNIESVDRSTLAYIKKNYLTLAIILGIICLFFIFLSIFYFDYGFLAVPILIFVFAYGYVAKKIRHAFMQQFAEINNFTYQLTGDFSAVGAPYLQMGRAQSIEDLVTGTYRGFPISFFNFGCTVGTGDSTKKISFTVCKIRYKTSLPRIFLATPRFEFSRSAVFGKNEIAVVSLEGDFNKYFTLYVPRGYEIEALQIFAPDVMAKLIDKAKKFSLEFKDDYLYIYSQWPIENKAYLNSLLELAQLLISELAPTLERLKPHN